jgi:MFS transporter, OPA family, glycerol-3-phosphate transporter
MRVAATWFPPVRRGRAIGIIGTGYQLAGALTYVLTGWAVEAFGWRGAMFVPAGVLVVSAVHMFLVLEEQPPRAADAAPAAAAPTARGDWRHAIVVTVSNPRLWLLALSLGLINACRFGFLDWGIAHLMEVQPDASIGKSALKYSVLPLGGIVGTLLSGWATDRFFGGRRIPVLVGMLVVLSALVLAYDAIVRTEYVLSVMVLALIGALIFGPQVLLVGTAPVDLARDGAAAAAVGFVNFFGYLGAFAGDQVTGVLVDTYDWHAALWFWSACALGAAVIVAPLWRATAHRQAS